MADKVNLLKVTQSTVKEFGDDDMATMAGALTYFTFLAVFPLIILVITIASFFFDSPEGRKNLTELLSGAFGNSDLHKVVNDAINNAVKDRGGASVFSLVGLIFSASGVFGTLSKALTRAWDAKPTNQNFILGYLTNIASLGVAGILIIAVNVATIVLSTVTSGVQSIGLLGLELPPWVFYLVNIVISVLALWGVFILMNKFLPKTHVEFKDVVSGSLIGAVGWTLLKELFGFYLAHFGPQAATYGSLSTVVALLLYIYFASMILLMSAEFCSEHATARKKLATLAPSTAEEAAQREQQRRRDPRYAVHQRLASDLDAVKARVLAREQTVSGTSDAAVVGAPAPQPPAPGNDPLPKAVPVLGAAAGAGIVAAAISIFGARRKA